MTYLLTVAITVLVMISLIEREVTPLRLFAMAMAVIGLLSSCTQGINFDPQWHIGDSKYGQIVPREPLNIVSCFDPEFDHYACMHEEKIKELREILIRARLPVEQEALLLSKLPDRGDVLE